MVERLHYLEPNEQLRAKWQYNNLMFLTAGYLTDTHRQELGGQRPRAHLRAAGDDAHQLLRSTIRRKTPTTPSRTSATTRSAKMPFRNITTIGPAGSINSSVNEMAQWVKVHLRRQGGDKQIGAAATVTQCTRRTW